MTDPHTDDDPTPDAPQAETPEAETPEVETPEVETPEVETPEVETPADAAPTYETLPWPDEPLRFSRAGWEYPVTLGVRFQRLSRVLIRGAATALALTIVAGLLIWGIPAYTISNSDDFVTAREFALQHRGLNQLLGGPLHADTVPRSYRLSDDGNRYQFAVRGPFGVVVVDAETREGRVVALTTVDLGD